MYKVLNIFCLKFDLNKLPSYIESIKNNPFKLIFDNGMHCYTIDKFNILYNIANLQSNTQYLLTINCQYTYADYSTQFYYEHYNKNTGIIDCVSQVIFVSPTHVYHWYILSHILCVGYIFDIYCLFFMDMPVIIITKNIENPLFIQPKK